MTQALPAFCLAVLAAGCVAPLQDDDIRVMRNDGARVVLRGLIDATRTEPPARYDEMAAQYCAQAGRSARFAMMEQVTTFAFDVSYVCEDAI